MLASRPWVQITALGAPVEPDVNSSSRIVSGPGSSEGTDAPATAQARWDADQLVTGPDPDAVAAQLGRVATAAGADSVNLRVHVPGVSVEAAREQIALLGSCGIRFDVDVHDR